MEDRLGHRMANVHRVHCARIVSISDPPRGRQRVSWFAFEGGANRLVKHADRTRLDQRCFLVETLYNPRPIFIGW